MQGKGFKKLKMETFIRVKIFQFMERVNVVDFKLKER